MTNSIERATDELESVRLRYLQVDTCNVADVLDDLGYLNQALTPDLRPIPPEFERLAGWAHTIVGQSMPYPVAEKDARKMEALSDIAPGSVSVWSGGGGGVCMFGELIAIGMKEQGCVGAFVDGGVRDVDWIRRQEFPVFARYRTPVQSIGRWRVTDHQVPISMPGATTKSVTVNPGDLVMSDVDGVIVVPRAIATEVLEAAEELGRREVDIRAHLSDGLDLKSALRKFGHV